MVPWGYGEVEAAGVVNGVGCPVGVVEVLELQGIRNSVSVPVVICPVNYSIVVVVPWALFLSCEASFECLLGLV